MSTNYYLRSEPCPHCHRSDGDIHIFQWPSGFQALLRWDHDTAEQSVVCGSWAEWRKHLEALPECVIVDEYGVTFTAESFAEVVESMDRATRRRQYDWVRTHQPREIRSRPSVTGTWLDPDGFTFAAYEFS